MYSQVDALTRTHTVFVDLLVALCAEKDGVICIAATSWLAFNF